MRERESVVRRNSVETKERRGEQSRERRWWGSDEGLQAMGGSGREGLSFSSFSLSRGSTGEGFNLISGLLDRGDASLLLGERHKLRMGHEVVDGAAGFWVLQPLVKGATERIHHLNL